MLKLMAIAIEREVACFFMKDLLYSQQPYNVCKGKKLPAIHVLKSADSICLLTFGDSKLMESIKSYNEKAANDL